MRLIKLGGVVEYLRERGEGKPRLLKYARMKCIDRSECRLFCCDHLLRVTRNALLSSYIYYFP